MRDYADIQQKLLAEAAECDLIAKLAMLPDKREHFQQAAERLRALAATLAEQSAANGGSNKG